jgi:hypothetical protein
MPLHEKARENPPLIAGVLLSLFPVVVIAAVGTGII